MTFGPTTETDCLRISSFPSNVHLAQRGRKEEWKEGSWLGYFYSLVSENDTDIHSWGKKSNKSLNHSETFHYSSCTWVQIFIRYYVQRTRAQDILWLFFKIVFTYSIEEQISVSYLLFRCYERKLIQTLATLPNHHWCALGDDRQSLPWLVFASLTPNKVQQESQIQHH